MKTQSEIFYEQHCHSGPYGMDYEARREAIEKFGFPVITDEAVQAILRFGPKFLEVGSGLGYLSYLIKERGGDVIATDIATVDHSKYAHILKPKHYWIWPQVMKGLRAVKRYPQRTLILSWPCYNDDWAFKVLRASQCRYLVYIGEGWGGCTATDKFFKLLDENLVEVEDLPRIPNWDGIHDDLRIFCRKS